MSKITQSARDEQCQIRLPFICNGNPATTVWCHANGSAAGKGIGMKAPDYLGAYGCNACHDVVDGRRRTDMPRSELRAAFADGIFRSQQILEAKGLLKVAA